MSSHFFRRVTSLDLEEKILNTGAIVALLAFFFPWFGGEWLGGDSVTYSAFSFYVSFLGLAAFILLLSVLLITLIPLTGGPVLVRKRYRETARLIACSQATVLILASLSVLTKVTFEFSRMEVRFGIYLALIGSLVATLYAFMRVQEQRRQQVQELFHHPDDPAISKELEGSSKPPPPPPPPAPAPEEHRIYP